MAPRTLPLSLPIEPHLTVSALEAGGVEFITEGPYSGSDCMNLWFRLIWMVLTARLRGKVQLFDTSVLRMRVMPNDLDLNGHVNNGRYFTLADLGRLDFVIRTGAARVAIANRAFPLIGDAVAKFRKDLKLLPTLRPTVASARLGRQVVLYGATLCAR
jgi:hypothetical protein